jgi:hypothetical protein
MPFDARHTHGQDDLSDIDKTKPLTIQSIQRIVRAVRETGVLAMDHAEEFRAYRGSTIANPAPYMTPHGAVGAFLGADAWSSCPCTVKGDARRFLVELNDLHRHLLFYRACAAARTDLIEEGLRTFEAVLASVWDFGM